MAADHRAIEEQHRHVEPVAAPKDGIGVHVYHLDGRHRQGLRERLQLREHLLAERAVAPVNYGENDQPFNAAEACARKGRPESAREQRASAWVRTSSAP